MADALVESEARLQAIIDNTTAVIYVKALEDLCGGPGACLTAAQTTVVVAVA